jgi:16S rRNA (cytosine1402-N4)-methyltransferase
MREQASTDNLPKNLPLRSVDLPRPRLRLVGKPVKADGREIAANPRARSAVMRVAEKCAEKLAEKPKSEAA